jgi:penicillin-binding protein 1C
VIQWDGPVLAGRVRSAASWARRNLRSLLLLGPIGVLVTLWLITIPPVMPARSAVLARWQPSEAWLYDREGRLLDSARVDFHARRLAWVPLNDIAPSLQQMVVSAEDKRFRDHGGVDWLAIGGAIRARFDGSHSRGASTLSMQVAGFLAPDLATPGRRSWLDKLRQMRAALSLDGQWSKDEILEAYFNLAGYRGEVQGIGAATLTLFGRTPDTLTSEDSVLLAALLPAPGANSARVAERACRLAPRLSCAALRQAAADMASEQRSLALDPGLAPHLAARMLNKPGLKITTTLDRNVQTLAGEALRRQMMALGRDRARDGAVIVADNQSGDILAYVGGVGGDSTAAFVDGASAPRQAGSTLKPFLYAMAIEKGYLTAASILDDSPVQLDTASGLYVPQNYDEAFKGPVSVRTALAGSLNIPAVRTLLLVGPDALRDRLWDSGYRGLTEDGQYYGYSLALGSAEVTLVEQAAAFRGLALGGRYAPLRLRMDARREAPRAVLSPQAAWITGSILSDPVARSVTFGLDSALKLPFWAAAKTGTSKGMRDNWCIGWSERYTVAVWVGNLEGDSMKAVSGTSGAAPVWHDIMQALHQSRPGKAPAPPPGVTMQPVSFDKAIESPRREWFMPGTAQAHFGAAPVVSRRPHITNPVSGSIFALDPDIPLERQRLAVQVSGEVQGHRLLLDRKDIGDASSRPLIIGPRGAHRLVLANAEGRVVDQVLFTIR